MILRDSSWLASQDERSEMVGETTSALLDARDRVQPKERGGNKDRQRGGPRFGADAPMILEYSARYQLSTRMTGQRMGHRR